jgi:hypothetical protein
MASGRRTVVQRVDANSIWKPQANNDFWQNMNERYEAILNGEGQWI